MRIVVVSSLVIAVVVVVVTNWLIANIRIGHSDIQIAAAVKAFVAEMEGAAVVVVALVVVKVDFDPFVLATRTAKTIVVASAMVLTIVVVVVLEVVVVVVEAV